MKNFIAIDHSKLDHHKYAEFDTAASAQEHIDSGNLPNGFVAPNPGGNDEFWIVDMVAKTVTLDSATETTVTRERAFTALRVERDRRIKNIMWRVQRVQRNGRTGRNPKDSLSVLDGYVDELSDLPASTTDPFNPVWPIEPS